ncbi:MAG: hypothetical protein ACTJGR_10440, partial [Pauljensenia sp.]
MPRAADQEPDRRVGAPTGDALARLLRDPPDLPVVAVLDRIAVEAHPGAALVLTAPPGTCKTTRLPQAHAVALASATTPPPRLVVR